ncbi:MAG: hypothetical protein CMN76_20240 [Spirochaetaceae bacterium]|nr:hypothetical protein [Spirochaetaceae bacterium]
MTELLKPRDAVQRSRPRIRQRSSAALAEDRMKAETVPSWNARASDEFRAYPALIQNSLFMYWGINVCP